MSTAVDKIGRPDRSIDNTRHAAAVASKRVSRISGLDGLRALSVGIVMISHYAPTVFPQYPALARAIPGMFGVYVFFVISGFLICTLLLQEFDRTGRISFKEFYIRRILRLQPALLIYVVICLFAYLIVDGNVNWWWFLSAATYTSNYYTSAVGAVDNGFYFMPVWSLAIEEHFYLVFPALLLIFVRRSAKVALWSFLGLTLVILLWRCVLVSTTAISFEDIYHNSDTRLDAPLFGVLLALVIRFLADGRFTRALGSGKSLAVGAAVLLLSLVVRDETFRMTLRYSLQGVGIFLFVGYIVSAEGRTASLIRRVLDSPIPRFFGKISYSLYLWHVTLLMFFVHLYPALSPTEAVLIGLASIGVACASYYFVERRFLRLRHRFGSHSAI